MKSIYRGLDAIKEAINSEEEQKKLFGYVKRVHVQIAGDWYIDGLLVEGINCRAMLPEQVIFKGEEGEIRGFKEIGTEANLNLSPMGGSLLYVVTDDTLEVICEPENSTKVKRDREAYLSGSY